MGTTINDDGFCLESVANIRIHHNYVRTNDDNVYIHTTYGDPRCIWVDCDNPTPSTNVEVDHNDLGRNTRTSDCGWASLNWVIYGQNAPDPTSVEATGFRFHDNTITHHRPTQTVIGNPWGSPVHTQCVKDFLFCNNTFNVPGGGGCTSPNDLIMNGINVTNLMSDCGGATSMTSLQNGDFELKSLNWSLRGTGSAKNSDTYAGSWCGSLEDLSVASSVFQGLYLAPATYTFKAKVKTSGAACRIFARKGSYNDTTTMLAVSSFGNTAYGDACLAFSVSAAGNYQIGIDNGGASSGWARIDNATLTTGNQCATSANTIRPDRLSAGACGHAQLFDSRGRLVGKASSRNPAGKTGLRPGVYVAERGATGPAELRLVSE